MTEMEALKKTNPDQYNAYQMIAHTHNSFFLTGKAGTGKTTFLKRICKEIPKNFLFLAPTGLAAVNLGGQTIHSFFGFKLGVLGPGETGILGSNKISLIRHIDTIIIDEVSMVRCDLIDAIDRTLRLYRKSSAPFGGIQMVFVGDMFQLEPVALQDERKILNDIYHTDKLYFYKSFAISRYDLPKIEFLRVYRQTDPLFIEILDHFRTGNVTMRDILCLNTRYVTTDTESDKLKITLTLNNKLAKSINDKKMQQLDGKEFTYVAYCEGDIRNLKEIVENELTLKVGSQVMFTRNDPFGKWVNGTLATVCSLSDHGITVTINDFQDTGLDYELDVDKVSWDVTEQVYDSESKSCSRKVVGRIVQYPLRPAWAITIHKSQGLTFDRVSIDLGTGSFACGQTYVALSRARSMEGIELVNRISTGANIVSKDVIEFAAGFNDYKQIYKQIQIGEAINEHINSNDFDGAASTLYSMACSEAIKGNLGYACTLMSNSMSYTADDTCLRGNSWIPFESDNSSHKVLNAFGLFYNGQKEVAEQILLSLGQIVLRRNFDALYILARCQEEGGKWDQMWETYGLMTDLYLQSRDNGSDSTSFRKFKYRTALLREQHGIGPGAGIMRELIAENPYYDKYYLALRWMICKNEEASFEAETSENSLVKALFDKDLTEEQFISLLSKERESTSPTFVSFIKFINNLKLALGN